MTRPDHARRPSLRSRFVWLVDQPDDADQDILAVALAFVVIVCAAIFAGAVW